MLAVSSEEMDVASVLCMAIVVACVATTTGPEVGVTGYRGNATDNSSRSSISDEMPDEQRLLMRLLRSYDPGIRPVFNVSHSVVVNFSLTLVQIMDMVSTLQAMNVNFTPFWRFL